MNSIEEQKKKIRKAILDLRGRMTKEEISFKSSLITEKLLTIPEYKSCSMVMCYVDFRNEVSTSAFINKCMEDGKAVSVPLIMDCPGKGKSMAACEIRNMEKDLEKGYFGVMEPVIGRTRRVDPGEIDFVVIPGVAFDIRKNRIGYGGGFYDRFLPLLKKDCRKIGVAFDIQVLKELPAVDTDIQMDIIVTESRIIY